MITNNNRIEGQKPSGLMLSTQLKTVETKGQPLKATYNSIRNLSCLRRERALQKSGLKSKQQCPQKSVLAER
ncbi:hypothetical protein Tco_0495363, partial [Tanacetum coccineum]